jgi:hypothetical protein
MADEGSNNGPGVLRAQDNRHFLQDIHPSRSRMHTPMPFRGREVGNSAYQQAAPKLSLKYAVPDSHRHSAGHSHRASTACNMTPAHNIKMRTLRP